MPACGSTPIATSTRASSRPTATPSSHGPARPASARSCCPPSTPAISQRVRDAGASPRPRLCARHPSAVRRRRRATPIWRAARRARRARRTTLAWSPSARSASTTSFRASTASAQERFCAAQLQLARVRPAGPAARAALGRHGARSSCARSACPAASRTPSTAASSRPRPSSSWACSSASAAR